MEATHCIGNVYYATDCEAPETGRAGGERAAITAMARLQQVQAKGETASAAALVELSHDSRPAPAAIQQHFWGRLAGLIQCRR
ncbi:hypothetical protein Y032_0182g883 [Ancylostoma ceylanicum]|uniref:Uncharacterized protein n=1 Tax=Ancylostoma ceylanicum TaxID=53326 RepID=A0A016SS94_9BILA|nr:hypothetical protein Y032_0182g883 [Ancylostoma ceylanicum]